MMHVALLASLAVFINALCALAGIGAAKRYGIALSLQCRSASTVLLVGTAAECVAVSLQSTIGSAGMLILAFGAVIAGAACDAECGYVFDVTTIPCVGAMSILALLAGIFPVFALGAGAAGGSLFVLYAITRGKGLGLGDVKLACCIGGAAGAAGGLEALGIAFVLGGGYASYLLLTKRGRRGDELRFAPYLAAGMTLAVLHGALT